MKKNTVFLTRWCTLSCQSCGWIIDISVGLLLTYAFSIQSRSTICIDVIKNPLNIYYQNKERKRSSGFLRIFTVAFLLILRGL